MMDVPSSREGTLEATPDPGNGLTGEYPEPFLSLPELPAGKPAIKPQKES
jgi:hypothetical protein